MNDGNFGSKDINDSAERIKELEARIKALEVKVNQLEANKITLKDIPRTDLLSFSFLKRAFAIFGHYFVASIIIVIPLYILIVVLALAISTLAR